MFDTIDTVLGCLKVYRDMLPAMRIKKDNMARAATRGFSTATDLADYLVRKGVAFRDAHEVVGKAVRYGIEQGKDLAAMGVEELRGFSQAIDPDVFAVLTIEGSVAARNHLGGTAPAQVSAAVARARLRLKSGA